MKRDFAKALENFGSTRGFIILLSLGLFAWGAFVFNPLVDTFSAANFYQTLASLASEEVWGAVFMLAGGVMAHGTIKRKVDVIHVGAMIGFLLWSFLSVAYALASPTVTPVVTNGILALIHGWAWLSVKAQPQVITNRHTYSDEEVASLMQLAEFRTNRSA